MASKSTLTYPESKIPRPVNTLLRANSLKLLKIKNQLSGKIIPGDTKDRYEKSSSTKFGNLPGIQNTKKRFLPPARCTLSGKSSKIMKPAINQTILKQNPNHRPTSGASLSPHRPSRIPVRVTSSVTRASIEDSLSMLLIKEISLMKKLYDVRLEIEQLDHDSTRWIYVPSQFSMKKNEANRLSCLTSSPFLSSQVSI